MEEKEHDIIKEQIGMGGMRLQWNTTIVDAIKQCIKELLEKINGNNA